MTTQFVRSLSLGAGAVFLAALGTTGALADSAGVTFSQGDKFNEQTGEALYSSVCAACHMPDGKGAVGAGHYPALAGNPNLESAGYPIYVVVHGYRNMPAVGQMMSDEQVAKVVNYVRTHFGNDYKDAATAEDVANTR